MTMMVPLMRRKTRWETRPIRSLSAQLSLCRLGDAVLLHNGLFCCALRFFKSRCFLYIIVYKVRGVTVM